MFHKVCADMFNTALTSRTEFAQTWLASRGLSFMAVKFGMLFMLSFVSKTPMWTTFFVPDHFSS